MKRNSGIVERVMPAVAAWAVTKLLETPRVHASVRSLDKRLEERRRVAETKLRRAVKGAGREPIPNAAWLAAGVVAFAVGVAFVAKASKKA